MGTVFLLGELERTTMQTTRRTSALPLPQAELDRLRSTLSPQYGGTVWEGAGARILVVCVPRGEPDLVNDIEAAVEYLSPADTQDLTAALLVGRERTMAVPTQPFADLMARRVRTDHEQCQEMRRRIPTDTGHLTYRHPADPRKVLRLAIRVPHGSVQEVNDADLTRWADELGPALQSGRLAGVRAVYLVAAHDDVRIDGDLFFQDLKARMADEAERRRMAAALVAKQAEKPAPPPAAPRVAYAPLKRIESTDAPAAKTAPAPGATLPPLAQAMKERLVEAGFDVLVAPPGKHALDLAAERAGGEIQRVIVRLPPHLTAEVAQQVLAATRALDVDLALVVCSEADAAARRAFIATKARWLHPDDLPHLHL